MPTSPLSFGLSLPNRAVLFGLSAETLLKTAEAAEASGAFDSVWVGDNLLFTPRLESVVLLSAIAARTSRVKLGTICLASFPLRDPLLFAIQWASLDLLPALEYVAEWKDLYVERSPPRHRRNRHEAR